MAENHRETEQELDQTDMSIKHRDGIITVILTADNHLGYNALGQQPHKREERQQRLQHAFQQATDFAIMQGVDLFIQAGDLFDTTAPDERDRSFVADRLAQLKQAGIKAFALGGVHDTPINPLSGAAVPAPQQSYARLGALHYFSPTQHTAQQELEPVLLDIDEIRVGICALGILAGQEDDPLAAVHVQSALERAQIALLILHAPIEGLAPSSSLLDSSAQVSRKSIEQQTAFGIILAGYHHGYSRLKIGKTEVVVAGSTQHIDFTVPDQAPGFVFMGIAADGIRWCNHISVDALRMQRLVIQTGDLWPSENNQTSPTDSILDRLRPLCADDVMVQLRLEGELTRSQYHQLNLNQIRHYGEDHCFALAIDDSALSFLPEQDVTVTETGERLSPREEIIALANEWIAAASDEQEKQALQFTKEELLLAIDEMRSQY
ncbi:MAG TPA: metallophosphoesterase [Ktedonobacteraceae bacterium]